MTVSVVSMIFDGVLACLLAVMIFYAIRLNQRIAMLRESEGELQAQFATLADRSVTVDDAAAASAREAAQDLARKLRAAGTETEVGVKAAVAKGNALRNDLELMIDQAIALIDKIEAETERQASIRQSAERAAHREPLAAPRSPVGTGAPASSAPQPAGNVRRFVPPAPPTALRPAQAGPAVPDAVEARTEAERQLLAAIRAAKEGVA